VRREADLLGGGYSGSKASDHTSTNQKSGVRKPREITWQDGAPQREAVNEWMSEEEGGFP
jgi:hypothetical protein